jgi:hypothetical protein
MQCSHCKTEFSEGDAFCVSCGKPLNFQQATSPSSSSPVYAQNVYYPPIDRAPANAIAIVGMVFGIVSIPMSIYVFPGIVGLILSLIGLVKSNGHAAKPKRSLAITGLITSIIGIVLTVILWAVIIIAATL